MQKLDERRIVIEKTENAKLTLVVRCFEEHVAIEGNAMASGDEKADKETESWIRSELDSGNYWAWCHVTVHAELQLQRPMGQNYIKHEIIESDADSLGCCSYKSAEDFMQDDGYFGDMKKHALESIRERDPRVKDALLKAVKDIVDLQGKAANGLPLSANEMRAWAVANFNAREAIKKAEPA